MPAWGVLLWVNGGENKKTRPPGQSRLGWRGKNTCYQTACGARGKDIIMTDIIMRTATHAKGAVRRFIGIKKGCRCGSLMCGEGAADSACRNAQIQHHHAGGHCVAEGEGRGLHTGFLELRGVYPLAGDLSRGGA
ncbi:MAG: hypothetical protein D6755_12940 [Anaerolineae bacterium]|nr:MAG: hypothetical protein D6755_12940 [Anaerolineae bacterium]